MTRVAAIDCGTNSIRLLVGQSGPDDRPVEVDRRLELVRLGQGVDATGQFAPEALERTMVAIDQFATSIRDLGVEKVRFVATSAARDAHNREDFFAGVRERLGIEAEVIPGTEEAELSFRGALSGVPGVAGPVLVIDIGGGSTELIVGGADGTIGQATSLDMGSVRLRERFLHSDPPTADEIAATRAFVDGLLDASGIELAGVQTFIGVAGTTTSLSAIKQGLMTYQREKVHGSVLTVDEVTTLAESLLATPVERLVAETCLPVKRAEVICAGALICERIASCVGSSMVVSEADILDGIVMQLLDDAASS